MKNAKVLLINPPETVYKQFVKHNLYFPLGLMYIASMIKNISDVEILDCMLTNEKHKKCRDSTLVGMHYEEVEKKIREIKPDIVGISILFFPQAEAARKISRICKKISPKTKVVFGGPYSTARYEKFLKDGNCDYCVLGEGEETFREFVEKFNSGQLLDGIEGLAYRKNKEVIFKHRKFIEDLDRLPYPAYDLVNIKEYLKNPNLYKTRSLILENSMAIITSRGCPFNCVFCSIRNHMGQKWRHHSPEYVINHIKYIIENFGIRNFHFEDDNISVNPERFKKILDGIIPLKIKWDAPNGMRADTLNYNILKKIKKSGNIGIQIAIESGNQRVLNDIIRKNTSLKKIEGIIKLCRQLKINIAAFYVVGFPGETKKEIKQTLDYAIDLLKEYGVSPCVYVATPIFGTDLYNICKNKGYIKKEITEKDLSTAVAIDGNHLISTEEFSKEDLDNLLHDYKQKLYKVYGIKHPIKTIKTFIDLFRQHPILTVKKIPNMIMDIKNKPPKT